MVKVYAFDVDESLEISNGPIKIQDLMDLRIAGDIVGICGNWGVFCQRVQGWQHLVSFINLSPVVQLVNGSIIGDKAWWLQEFRKYVKADEYIMVGNIYGEKNGLGFTCGSKDSEAAERACWRFIKEDAFATGER